MSFVDKVKGFLRSPTDSFAGSADGTIQGVRTETLGSPLKYTLIWLVIFGAILGISAAVSFGRFVGMIDPYFPLPGWVATLGIGLVPITLGFYVVAGIVFLFIGSAWTHLWVYLLGGREGYTQTLKALAYGATPSYVVGVVANVVVLIPFIGWVLASIGGAVASVWAIVIGVIGVKELHSITTGRAVGAYLLALFAPVVIIVVIIAASC